MKDYEVIEVIDVDMTSLPEHVMEEMRDMVTVIRQECGLHKQNYQCHACGRLIGIRKTFTLLIAVLDPENIAKRGSVSIVRCAQCTASRECVRLRVSATAPSVTLTTRPQYPPTWCTIGTSRSIRVSVALFRSFPFSFEA